MRTTEPTVEEFSGNALKYYAAVVEYKDHLKQELKLYKKIMDEEVYPLTEFISENEKVNLAAWGKSSCLVAIKYIKHLEERIENYKEQALKS